MIKKKPRTIASPLKGKLIITQEVEDKIQYLCRCFPMVEWSGTLFYRVTAGSIDGDLANLTMETVDLYLQDIGVSAHTQFTVTDEILDVYEHNPVLEDCKQAMIHSHNNMGVFFSGEDMSELEDNYEMYDFFLSLIVNNRGDRLAKIAIPVKKTTKSVATITTITTVKNAQGLDVETVSEPAQKEDETVEDIMYTVDIDIERQLSTIGMEQFFVDRITELSKPKPYTTPTYNYGGSYNRDNNRPLYSTGYVDKAIDRAKSIAEDKFERDFANEGRANTFLEAENSKKKQGSKYGGNGKFIFHDHKGVIQFGMLMFTSGIVKDGTLRTQLERLDNTVKNVPAYVAMAFSRMHDNYKTVFGTNPKPDELCDVIWELEKIYDETCKVIVQTTAAGDALMMKLLETADTITIMKTDDADTLLTKQIANEIANQEEDAWTRMYGGYCD